MDLTLDQVLQKGIEAYKAGKIQEAEKFYTGILQSHPKHPGANHNMGVLAFGIGKAQEALLFFQTAVKEEPSIVQFRISHIEALMKLDKFSDARAAINQAHDKGIKGDAFDQLEQRINELDGNDTDVEDSRTSEKRSNILDTLTLDQAVKLARKKLKGGFSEEAKSLYKDILVRFPKNKKATDGVKVISSGLSGAASINQNPSSEQLQPLINLYNQGHNQQTLNQVTEMLKQFPGSLALHNICGAAHAGLGNFAAAIESYKKAIKINPNFAECYSNMGNALKDKGELDTAIESYKKAIKVNPNFAEAYNNMGSALKDRGELDAAIKSCKQAVKINPGYAEAYSNMGNALHNKGDLDSAIASYEKAIKINPSFAGAYNNMGNALRNKGELNAAIASFKQAIKINPDYAEAYNNMGNALRERGELDAAIKSYKQILKTNPYFVEAYNNMSIVLREKGELEAAIESCKQAIKIDPGYAEAYSNMGNALQDKGELDTAIESYKQAIEIKPDYAEAYNNIGNALKDRGELDTAMASYKQAIKINPSDAEAHFNLGVLLFEMGQYKKSAEQLKLSDLSESETYYLRCLYLQDEQLDFYNQLDYLVSEGEINAVIGSLSSRSEIKYGLNRPNPFCNEPLKYVLTTDLTKRCDFKNIFVKVVRDRLADDSVEYKDQGHLTNGIQTAGSLFAEEGELIGNIKDIIQSEIEKYLTNFKNSKEGFIKNWPSDYDLYGWLISMKSGGKLAAHMHDGGWITGSVYINIPPKSVVDSGNLVVCLEDPQNTADENFEYQKIINVNTGSLCLFPSSLLHYTIPFESTEERIVLAFDMIPK